MSPARQNVFVGIDVAKDWLDIAVRPTGAAWRVAQDDEGIADLVRQLANLQPRLIVRAVVASTPPACPWLSEPAMCASSPPKLAGARRRLGRLGSCGRAKPSYIVQPAPASRNWPQRLPLWRPSPASAPRGTARTRHVHQQGARLPRRGRTRQSGSGAGECAGGPLPSSRSSSPRSGGSERQAVGRMSGELFRG